MGADDLLAAGEIALKDGRWPAAKEAFRAALDLEESAEALFGLGVALWWFGDMRGTLDTIERAYGAFVRRPDPTYAAACALRLSFHYQQHLGNPAAASGWFARASRLVEEHDVAPLRGELLLMKACLAADPFAGEVSAREALALGRSMGDRDLELCALAQLGAVLAAQGKIHEGVAFLDEAMAGCAGGEPNNRDTVVFTHCLTMTTCTRCAQFERAVRWVQVAERYADQIDFPFFYVECRALFSTVLFLSKLGLKSSRGGPRGARCDEESAAE
jgi:tetratricopeptide (TPR) repeat protein